ncbi:hypothetical protein PENSOL_c006G02994 [Penicillium solitum]|uniref:Uncharacterized protein n=1 Tax=Penicillium solitum TaxID=60172 RepID=A0A1V6RDU4_9EURO|nr:uncharacterized protein PENSOL_c006G02994 [Penicillium solitum]OQD99579.1 hypothetical protein PENSOL_c006G02994 [Penicillium solitum]
MVAKAHNNRYHRRSKVPSQRQALAHTQSPTTDAAAPNKTKVKWTSVTNPIVSVGWSNPAIIKGLKILENPQAQGILLAANNLAGDRTYHGSMVAGLLSCLESKRKITRFALRSALDRVRPRGPAPPPPLQTDHRRHGELSGTAVQGGWLTGIEGSMGWPAGTMGPAG